MTFKTKLLLAVIVEVLYIASSRCVTSHFDNFSPNAEYLRTAIRLTAALAYFYIFKSYILSFKPTYHFIKSPYFSLSLCLLFMTPLLVGNLYFMGGYTRILFAVTSIAVGLYEELVFRVLIQNTLASKIGTIYSILLTSLIFTTWHYGAIPNEWFSFGQVFIISIFIGLTYAATKSFVLVVALHAIYDALWSLTPIYSPVINLNWGFIPLIIALLITIFLYQRFRNA